LSEEGKERKKGRKEREWEEGREKQNKA